MAITTSDPIRQDGRIVPGTPARFAATLASAVPEGETITLRIAPAGASEATADVATVVMDLDAGRTLASATLTLEQVETVLGESYTVGYAWVRYRITSGTGDALVPLFAGQLAVKSRWDGVTGVALTAAASESQAATVAANAAQVAQAAAEAAAAAAAGASDAGVAGLVTGGALTSAALSSTYAPVQRRFVVFGDSWTTTLDGVNIPQVAVGLLGGTIVKSYGIPGAFIGPTTYGAEPAKASQAQVNTAAADATVNRNLITDVLFLAAVNNVGGFLPTVPQAVARFAEIKALYPNARCWYAANSAKGINNYGIDDPWRWYSHFFEAASIAGFTGAEWSPMWHWSATRDADGWWPVGSTDSHVHLAAAGGTAWAGRLASFLSGNDGWRPHFRVPVTIHPDATAIAPAAGLAHDGTFIDGATLRLNVVITGMDALTVAPDTNVLQIPTAYAPIGAWMVYPAAAYKAGKFDWSYSIEAKPGAVIAASGKLLNEHESFFELRADIPLNVVKGL